MNDTQLAIVIVNWNSGRQLQECTESVFPAVARSACTLEKTVVVDNGSSDGSADFFPDASPKHQLIRNHSNQGFAAACNAGAKACNAEYILFLNPDARLEPDSLRTPLEFLASPQSQQYVIVGIQAVDSSGTVQATCARFPTPTTLLGISLGLDRLLPRVFRPHFIGVEEHASDCDVDQVIGAFFLMRRSAFVELNGFDERFFVYYEELDLALRARQRGWKTRYLSGAHFFHKGGGTSDQVKAKRLFYNVRSRFIYGLKHFGVVRGMGLLVAGLIFEPPVRCLHAIGTLDGRRVVDTLFGYLMVFFSVPAILRAGLGR